MAVYNIYHKDGSRLKDSNGKGITVHSIEYNGTWMGECFVTVTFENEAPISFSIGDYIEYRGERFEINYDPGKIKCASKDSYGGAFKYDSIKFNALSDELVRCDMLDLVLYDNQLHYTALPQFSFYVESLDDLLDRIQANLDELYGKASWKLYSRNKERSVQRGGLESEWNSIYGEGTADNVIDSTSISISDQTCWDALSLVNSQFDINFIIRNRNVYVGTAGMPTTNIFKYGKGEGLYEIEQNSESDQMIVTRLRAYGSNRNLPNHYYADLGGVPFLNITGDYHEGSTENGLSVMMEDSTYAGMFTDIISDNGSNTKHCRIRGSIGGYEFDGTLELVKKNVTRSTTRLLAEGKEVSDAIKAKIDAGIVEVDFVRGANKAKFDGNRINYVSNLPNNMACDRLMLPGFPNKSLKEWWDAQSAEKKAWLNPSGKEHIFSNDIYRPYVDSLNIEKIGVRPSSVFFDQDDKVNGIVEIYPTIEEMEVDGVRIDEIYTGTNVEDDGRFGDDVSDIANVAIYLSPKINFDIRGLMQEDFTIHMKDGMCAGREFKVAGCTKQNDGSWKLMIERKPDDSLNLYFPYNDFQIKKGDHFVLSGIELPDAYVEAASEKLLRYCIAYLDKNDYTRYVYQPKVDEIFMARQHDTAMADASGLTKSLYLTLKEGDIMLFKDDDLGIDAEITIDQLTIKEEDGKIPTYEITLREEKEVGTIQKIQNQISSITNGNGGSFTGGTGGGGLSSSQIKNLIDAIGSDRFLSKLNPDTAAGIITFLKGTNWGSFTSETGAAMTVDPTTGQTYMEVDRLKVRLKAFFEQLEVQKVGYVGGKIVVSKGQGVDILDVEEVFDSEGNLSAYRCYFLGEQEGRRINNLLRVDDQMICKDENISEGSTDGATNKYYWRLATAVSSDVVKRGNNVCHWVDLSATDCDTNSDVPEIGDTICQLGNRNDVDRQGAEILSVVDANSPSFTIYSGINSYSLVNKEYIDMGVSEGKAFCNIYGSTYIGDRERSTGYLRWNDDTKTFEIKGTIDISSPLSSGGTIGGAINNAANAYKDDFSTFTSNVNEIIGGFQKQIDGVIETWFYDPEPTLGNLPASEWKDNDTKDKHLGDLYYSKDGLAYRFQKEGDIYKWVQIDDTAITSALKEAKAAKDAAAAAQGTADSAQTTANSKMKVFVKQPTNNDEYSVGDMWVNATYPADGSTYSNEILKCKEGKAAGADFDITHWEKASKYTDDTAAKAAQATANAAAAAAKNIDDAILAIDNNVDVALKDKIITKTEAAAITEALNSLSAIMADVTKTHAELVNNDVYKLIAADTQQDFDDAYKKLGDTFKALSDYITNTLTKANPITSEILSTYNTHYTNFKTDYEAYVSKLNVVRNSMDALLNTRIGDISTMLGGLKATQDAMDETTQINGGLILSTLLALGYTDSGNNFNVMSGVSGLYESDTEKGGGIAFWAGGHRIDINDCTKNTDGTYSLGGKVVNPADFLVRHDGTGYAAGGALWWEKDGKVHADPQSFLINEQYVGNVMQLFKFVYSGGTAFENIVHAIPQKPFESLSVGANGLTLYNGKNTAKLYIKNGVLFIEGDLAVTGGITMYASDGVKSGMIDQVYAVLDQSLFSIKDGVITITGEIGGGTVKAVKIGSTQYDPDANGIIALTLNWGDLTGVPATFTPSAHTHDDRYYIKSDIDTKLGLKLDTSLKGVANGLATLDASGKVPSAQLPSYVDDVLECVNKASFPATGESGKIYIDQTTNLTYRWGGTAYVEISQSLALGETSSTAYAGDKGKQNAADIASLKTGKADKATTLSGYGITDAYTKTEVNTKLNDGSVTKIGTKDVGSATLPIYLKAGVPTACNTTLGVSITGNSSTATKLKASITLWGQSFDGSANVSGDMTGVGTITPTGEDLKVVGNLIVTGGIVMYADDGATIESGFAALLAAHIDGVTIKYNEAQQKIYSVMTGIKVNGATYKPSETDGYITIPDYPTSLDWENIENKPSTFTPASHTHTFASLTSKPTTLSGYGITDAKIANGVITLGTATITPLTAHQTVTLASGTNNGTLKLTVNGTATDNIAVKGLGSAAFTASSAYAAASHTHSQYLVAASLDGYVNTLTDNTSTNVFVTAISKSGKTLSYTKSFTKKSLTAASHSGWSSADTDKLIIPDMSFIAYWNGAYNSDGKSNLAYCNKGAFGDMATAAKSSYYTKTEVGTKLTDGSVTKLGTATVGSGTQHFYLNGGTATASTSTVGGTAKPMYLKAGVMTAISDTVGGTAKPIFLNAGTLTAISATVGSASKPVYLSGGSITACSYDFTSYLPLAGGTMIAGARISHADGNMYLGRADNNGWVMCQDMCSQSGSTYWKLMTNGTFHSTVAVVSGNTSVGSLTINGINVTKSSDGILKIDGNLIVTGGITMYATDGVASGLMEQILVDGTTIGKKADGTLYAINTGNVRSIIMGSTTYTPNDSGAVTLPEKVTWANIEGKPSTFAPSAHTHSYLPLAGGTLTGALVIQETTSAASYAMSGGAFHAGYANIILRGNSSTGVSGIVFTSSKGTTNINQTSDRGFIQFHAYGVTPAAEGTDPTLSTSGEVNRLVIGVGNDGDDMVYIQTPASTGLRHLVGTSAHVILDSGNFGDYAAAKSHTHAISQITNLQATLDGKAAASHTHSYLPLSGGTMTGALNFKNSTWNLMGDDAYIGDCDVAGMIGVKGANAATPGFVLYDNSGTLLGKLYASGSNITWNGTALSLAGHTHSYLYTEQVAQEQNSDVYTWIRSYVMTHKRGHVYNTSGLEWQYLYGIKSDGAYGNIIRSTYGDGVPAMQIMGLYNGNWSSWVNVLTEKNYNSYAPTLTGTGASGTWGISISGNAATSTKSSYARGILGRYTNGNDYGATDDNIIIAEWNTNSDNRWYLTAKGYECGVGYAKTATKLTSSAGSATLPIYFSDGKPVACTASSVFSNLSNSGNNISVTVAGQNRTLTVGYASNCDTVDGYHASSFTKKHTEYDFNTTGTAPYNYVWLCRIGNSDGYSGMAITLDVNSRYHKHYQINMLISTGQYAYSSSSISINKSDSAPNVYYVRTANGSDIGYDYFDIYVDCGAWNYGGYKIANTNVQGALRFTNKCTLVDSLPSGATAVGLMYSSVNYATSAGNSDTCDGLHVHGGRNNEANKIVRTDGNGYIQCGYINSSSGNEGNNSSPARVWGTNGSDNYMRTYLTSALNVYTSGSVRSESGNKTTGLQYYSASGGFTKDGTGVSGAWSVPSDSTDAQYGNGQAIRMWWDSKYYTDILSGPNVWGATKGLYIRQIVAGAISAGTFTGGWRLLLDSSNYNRYAPTLTGKGASGTWGISVSGNAATASKWATARTITLTGSVTGSVSIDGSGNVTLATATNHTHNYLPLAGGTMTGTINANDNVQNTGIKFKNNNANLNALSNQHLILGTAIRFGEYNTWDWNVWAGLKYDRADKTIYLGLADGTTFNANSAQSGGKVKFPGVSNLYISEIDDAGGGNGLVAYKPAAWTGVSSSQTGFGTIITETVIRSSNSSLKHYRNGSGTYTIWDSGNHGSGSGLNADLLDGVHYLNILEREYTGSKYDSSATTKTGWYRIAECYTYSKNGFLLYLGRNYHSSNNENYIFAITVSYGGNISISQIAGSANTRLITKIRVCWSNTSSNKAYVDFYVGTEAINGYFWYTVGSAKSYGTWGANPSTSGYNTVEFSTRNGMSSNKDFYISGQISREGKNSSWIVGRTNAMIRQTTANGYSPFASIKTANGSWEIGDYTALGERLLFTYVTDTNVNNGNNNYSGQISFESGGNILASGGITMYSDLRKKNILSDEVLSVKEIAAAPLFRHTYKSDDNQYIHVGTSAQYWSGIHEDWFTRKDSEGYYQMELQNLGVAMGISLAREIVTFEGAFKKYESKTDKKIKLMKKKINDLEARIKELEGSREERRTA